MSRPLWFVEIIQHFFPDRFKIAGWTKKSTIIRLVVDFFLFKGDKIFYLPKDKVVADVLRKVENWESSQITGSTSSENGDVYLASEGLQTCLQEETQIFIREPVEQNASISMPSTIIKEFIGAAKYIWLMDKCLCRDTMQCKDYPIDIGCIFMGEAVLGINPKLGHMATKEEANARIDLAQEYGLVHLIGKNKIDTQWMGVHPGDKLLTVCSCCPCCCLYKVLPDLDDSIKRKIEKMPGLEVTVNLEKCIGCGKCTDDSVCMTHNIEIVNSVAVMGDICVGCGRCFEVCPSGAIEFVLTNDDFIQETIRRVKSSVDVI